MSYRTFEVMRETARERSIANEAAGNLEKVTKIPPAVIRRRCPGCRYLITQNMALLLVFDAPCPRCYGYTVNEFEPDNDPPSPKTENRKRRAA